MERRVPLNDSLSRPAVILDTAIGRRGGGDHDAENAHHLGIGDVRYLPERVPQASAYRFLLLLSDTTTRRIFRRLDKFFRHYPTIEVDILRFAHGALGFGVFYKYTSQALRKLEKRLDELVERGFCRWETVES